MYQLKQLIGYLLLGIGLASAQSHASIIQSMTIEEIGVASGGLGTSLIRADGGQFSFNAPQAFGSFSFGSVGSTDGAIIMGTTQADLAFTPGFLFGGFLPVAPNTLSNPARGQIENSILTLDLSGWGANVQDIGYFSLPPDIGTLLTSTAIRDDATYFYTADWSHQITARDDPSGGSFIGLTTFWHLEGIATVPEPGTLWLLGASALGLMVSRRRKRS